MLLIAPILLSLPAASLPAPQAKIARLEDGTRIRCVEAEPGAERFETAWGDFLCPGNPVSSVVEGDTEWKVLESIREYNYDSYLREASRRGFLDPLFDAARVKGKKAEAFDQAAVLRELERWGPWFDSVPSKLEGQERVNYLWDKIRKGKPGQSALLTGRLIAELDRQSLNRELKIGLADIRRGLRDNNPSVRRAAALVASRVEEHQAFSPLLKTAVRDDSRTVRTACADTLIQLDQDRALSAFSSKLWRGKSEDERVYAAEHLGNHGDALSVDILMVPLFTSTISGGGAQATAYFGRQVSVVADFDVEIAQAAAIADPRVLVIQEGISLQVRVVSVRLVRTIMGSLRKLTRANPGPQAKDWLRWHEER
jgi:HEAT repeat protein